MSRKQRRQAAAFAAMAGKKRIASLGPRRPRHGCAWCKRSDVAVRKVGNSYYCTPCREGLEK